MFSLKYKIMLSFFVKLEFCNTPNMVLAKNVEIYGKIIPFGFKQYSYKLEIAYFDTKEDAVRAIEESEKHNTINGIPTILETFK